MPKKSPFVNDGLRVGVETVVFQYDTPEEREELIAEIIKPLWDKATGLRVTAISRDNEIQRVELIAEAAERIDDPFELEYVRQQILDCPDLSKWDWEKEDD